MRSYRFDPLPFPDPAVVEQGSDPEIFLKLDDQVFKSWLLIVNHLNTLKVWLKLNYFFLSISQKKLTYWSYWNGIQGMVPKKPNKFGQEEKTW